MAKEKASKKSKAAPSSKKTTKAIKSVKNAKKATGGAKVPPKGASLPVTVPSAEKQEIIAQFQVSQGDTGSPEVQIALLTKRIEKLVSHLKTNPADNHSRRGLLGIVSKRRRLLNYLEKKDDKRNKAILTKLGLGK